MALCQGLSHAFVHLPQRCTHGYEHDKLNLTHGCGRGDKQITPMLRFQPHLQSCVHAFQHYVKLILCLRAHFAAGLHSMGQALVELCMLLGHLGVRCVSVCISVWAHSLACKPPLLKICFQLEAACMSLLCFAELA